MLPPALALPADLHFNSRPKIALLALVKLLHRNELVWSGDYEAPVVLIIFCFDLDRMSWPTGRALYRGFNLTAHPKSIAGIASLGDGCPSCSFATTLDSSREGANLVITRKFVRTL
jgi:hypothetical protein